MIRFQSFDKRSYAVGSGTALQAGRSGVRFSMVSLELFQPEYGPGATQPLTDMNTGNISWRLKAAGT